MSCVLNQGRLFTDQRRCPSPGRRLVMLFLKKMRPKVSKLLQLASSSDGDNPLRSGHESAIDVPQQVVLVSIS
jgi:hypothetical protein